MFVVRPAQYTSTNCPKGAKTRSPQIPLLCALVVEVLDVTAVHRQQTSLQPATPQVSIDAMMNRILLFIPIDNDLNKYNADTQ